MKTNTTTDDMSTPTWQPPAAPAPGRLGAAAKKSLAASAFAFPRARKEPMTDAWPSIAKCLARKGAC